MHVGFPRGEAHRGGPGEEFSRKNRTSNLLAHAHAHEHVQHARRRVTLSWHSAHACGGEEKLTPLCQELCGHDHTVGRTLYKRDFCASETVSDAQKSLLYSGYASDRTPVWRDRTVAMRPTGLLYGGDRNVRFHRGENSWTTMGPVFTTMKPDMIFMFPTT